MSDQPLNFLTSLIEEGKISRKTICIAAKISEETLMDYLSGNKCNLNPNDALYLDELSILIGHGLKLVSEDERLKAILESLIYDYGFSSEQLSKLLNIDIKIIDNVLNSVEIAVNDKYSLAIKEAYLFYALKRTN